MNATLRWVKGFSVQMITLTLALYVLASSSAMVSSMGGNEQAGHSCSGMAAVVMGVSKVVSAELVDGDLARAIPELAERARDDPAAVSGVPPFCRVVVHTSFSTDSSVWSEVWLPVSGWNGRFLGTGNGGFAGRIVYDGMLSGIRRGFAVANTDMGTGRPADGSFPATGHPIKWWDYGRRSTHEMTVAGKALAERLYGEPPQFSYWEGCSTGGFQGQRNAQFFPDDYDGILAGSPGNWRSNKVIAILRNYMQPKLHPEGRLDDDELMVMHRAVLAECAGLAGGSSDDPFLAMPYACDWKPESLLCESDDGAGCLTQAQVDMANFFYSPFLLESSGRTVWPGLPRGTELGWKEYMDAADAHDPPHAEVVRSVLGPGHDFWTSDWDRDVETYLHIQGYFFNDGPNTDLSAFRGRGGKLLMYFGWNDTSTSYDTTDYYEAVEAELRSREPLSADEASEALRDFFRLFMLPGVEHCGRGNGPNTFDGLTPLMQWVEEGMAPERIEASFTATPGRFPASLGRPMTRPLCPYPQVATYEGSGDKTVASSFVCRDLN